MNERSAAGPAAADSAAPASSAAAAAPAGSSCKHTQETNVSTGAAHEHQSRKCTPHLIVDLRRVSAWVAPCGARAVTVSLTPSVLARAAGLPSSAIAASRTRSSTNRPRPAPHSTADLRAADHGSGGSVRSSAPLTRQSVATHTTHGVTTLRAATVRGSHEHDAMGCARRRAVVQHATHHHHPPQRGRRREETAERSKPYLVVATAGRAAAPSRDPRPWRACGWAETR